MNGLEIEEKVRNILSKRLRKELTKQRLVIGSRSSGELIKRAFDVVSNDLSVIGEIKSSKMTSENAYTSTRKWRLFGDCLFLRKCKAKKKLFVLTDKKLYLRFKKDSDGLIDKKIEIIYIPIK